MFRQLFQPGICLHAGIGGVIKTLITGHHFIVSGIVLIIGIVCKTVG